MSEETAKCKIPMLFEEDVFFIACALFIAINYYQNNEDHKSLARCQKVALDFHNTPWKELPTPNTLNK
jgi:hypothetical protein